MMGLATGTKLGRYEVRSKLGEGGMGEVYLARDTKLDRRVALKILPEEVAADRNRMNRFVQEAKAASALNHPNIITIYEIEQIDSVNFIATEFIDGVTLRERMRSVPMKVGEVLDVAGQIASALSAAHTAGILHRDIKPENIMLRRDGIVKVLDFGLAKLTERPPPDSVDTEAPTSFKTDPGTVVGTAVYMSPEQARGMPVDVRTDIFSLGIVLYEMVAERLPFEGSTSSEVLASILSEKEPQPLARYSREVPAELERIVSKALRKNRDERYQTIKDLLLDLQSLKQELEFERKLERSLPPTTKSVAEASEQAEGQTVMESATRPTVSEGGLTSAIKLNQRSAVIAVAALLIIASAVGAYFYFTRARGGVIDSIAVLPFQNKSSDADTEYLSDGLAESLIYRLSQLPNLKVSPTSSVFRYKGKETDAVKIGNELGVNAVMSGRIVQRGDNLTISVELVDVRNNKLLWGEQYERKMSELLTTQREIAAEITNKLRLKLSGEGEQKLAKKYTTSNEAYQLYLKGRFYWAKRTKDDLLKAVDDYKQAIALDPNFALAYVGIATAYNSMGKDPDISPKEAFPQAKAAATRALEIDPALAEAHAALADSLAIFDWNWAESERGFKRAIELDPNVSYIHLSYAGSYLTAMGRANEVVAETERAMELEPLSLINNTLVVTGYVYARQNDKALQQARKAYDLDPNFPLAQLWLGLAYVANGKYDNAITLGEGGLQKSPSNPMFFYFTGLAYAKSGRKAEAQQFIARLKEVAKTQYVRTYYIACIYAALGDKDKAFAELEQSFEDKDSFLPRMKIDPLMDPLREDPRFKDLLKRMGLPE